MSAYFHDKVDDIVHFAASNGLRCFLIGIHGNVFKRMEIEYIGVYLQNSHTLYGAYPDDFLFVASRLPDAHLSIGAAISFVESDQDISFVLFGFNDGGVYSISGKKLAFQEGLEEYPNWRPYGSAAPGTLWSD